MNTIPQLPPEAAYLTNAAHLLRQAVPETAARLMRVRNQVLLHAPGALCPLSDAQRQTSCTACGNIFIPGRDGDEMHIVSAGPAQRRRRHRASVAARLASEGDKTQTNNTQPKNTQREKTQAKNTQTEKIQTTQLTSNEGVEWGATKVYTCGRCQSRTRIRIPAPPRVSKLKKKSRQKMQKPKEAEMQTKPLSSSTTDTKQAANSASKQRKKSRKAGLQALLAGQAAQPKSFSLMDFKK